MFFRRNVLYQYNYEQRPISLSVSAEPQALRKHNTIRASSNVMHENVKAESMNGSGGIVTSRHESVMIAVHNHRHRRLR